MDESGVGTLYLVATPIGNLDDLSARAVRVLGEADRVLCEDTRRTGRLLSRIGIKARLESHHEHNERARVPKLVDALVAGATIALVTDAGTPCVSDPGFRLVRGAARAGVRIVPVPGPSAVLAALAVSGLPTDRFFFLGYLPTRSGRRREAIREIASLRATLVIYEAPHRITKTLAALLEGLGDRDAVLCRELTKLHEEIARGTLSELERACEATSQRGEITLVVDGHRADTREDDPEPFTGEAKAAYERHLADGLPPDEAASRTREIFGGTAKRRRGGSRTRDGEA